MARELEALLAERTDTNAAQLRASNGTELLFEGVVAKGDLRGLCLEMSVEQRFRNPGDDHLEVVYSFPLPWRAVLLGVEVLLGDKRLSGRVSEKAAATQKYEDTIADGDAAIMLECNHDESYTHGLGVTMGWGSGLSCLLRASLPNCQTSSDCRGCGTHVEET